LRATYLELPRGDGGLGDVHFLLHEAGRGFDPRVRNVLDGGDVLHGRHGGVADGRGLDVSGRVGDGQWLGHVGHLGYLSHRGVLGETSDWGYSSTVNSCKREEFFTLVNAKSHTLMP